MSKVDILIYFSDTKPNSQHGCATEATYTDEATNGIKHNRAKQEMKTEFKAGQDEMKTGQDEIKKKLLSVVKEQPKLETVIVKGRRKNFKLRN